MKLRKRKWISQKNIDKQSLYHKRIGNDNPIKKQKFIENIKEQKCFITNIKNVLLKKLYLMKYMHITMPSEKDNEKSYEIGESIIDITFTTDEIDFTSYHIDNLYLELLKESTYNVEYIFNHITEEKVLFHQRQIYGKMIIFFMHIHSLYPTISIKTLFLATSLVSDILKYQTIGSKDAVIIAIACCFIASKFEDVLPITLDNCVKLGNYEFSKNDVCAVEQKILNITTFRLIRSYSIEIARKLLDIQTTKNEIKQICDVICICCTLDSTISSEKPSSIASCAILISHKIFDEEPDSELVKWLSFTSTTENRYLMSIINEHMKVTIPNLYEKYYCFKKFINQIANNEMFEFIIKSTNY